MIFLLFVNARVMMRRQCDKTFVLFHSDQSLALKLSAIHECKCIRRINVKAATGDDMVDESFGHSLCEDVPRQGTVSMRVAEGLRH